MPSVSTTTSAPGAELWNYSENIYKGRFIEQLDVAALGPGAPRIPGLPRIPAAAQFYASPALSRLLKTVPADQLGDRLPGQQAGLLGDPALSGPDQLAIVVGYSPSQLAALPETVEVSRIATAPQLMGTTNLYRLGFGIAAVVILFPLLILINTATRLAATRREERLAALRLVGATPRQVNVVASVEAVVTASTGVVIGVLAFLAIRPLLESISFSGVQFFGYTVTPTLWGYLAMVVMVPLLAALSSLISLRRVWITPLGVSRRTTPRPPRWWRVLPILVGIPLFIAPLVSNPGNPDATRAFIGLFLMAEVVGPCTAGGLQRFAIAWAVILVTVPLVFTVQQIVGGRFLRKPLRGTFPGPELARQVEQIRIAGAIVEPQNAEYFFLPSVGCPFIERSFVDVFGLIGEIVLH